MKTISYCFIIKNLIECNTTLSIKYLNDNILQQTSVLLQKDENSIIYQFDNNRRKSCIKIAKKKKGTKRRTCYLSEEVVLNLEL
jgi:hypothetical protein